MYDMYPDYESQSERGAAGLGHYEGYLAPAPKDKNTEVQPAVNLTETSSVMSHRTERQIGYISVNPMVME